MSVTVVKQSYGVPLKRARIKKHSGKTPSPVHRDAFTDLTLTSIPTATVKDKPENNSDIAESEYMINMRS